MVFILVSSQLLMVGKVLSTYGTFKVVPLMTLKKACLVKLKVPVTLYFSLIFFSVFQGYVLVLSNHGLQISCPEFSLQTNNKYWGYITIYAPTHRGDM